MKAVLTGNEAYFVAQDAFDTGEQCGACGLRRTSRRYGISLAYQGGTPLSFATAGIMGLLAMEDVGKLLIERFACISIEKVYILKSAWSGPYGDKTVAGAKKYQGPRYVELKFNLDLPLDLLRSTIDLADYCVACGSSGMYRIIGAEESPKEALIGDRWEMQPRKTRTPGKGLMVPATDLGVCKAFKYGGRYNLCTEEVRDFIATNNYLGLEFLEVGTLIEG